MKGASSAPAVALASRSFVGHARRRMRLATRIAVVLGESSYSLYMLHVFMLLFAARNPQWFATWSIGYRVLVGFTAIVGAAWVLWRFFERPARQWLLRRLPTCWQSRATESGGRAPG